MNNQSIKADAGKPRLSLVPSGIIYAISRVREYGVKKYGAEEAWREVEPQRYIDAAYRHFLAYVDDPDGVDEESGLPHLDHLACNIDFLIELRDREALTCADCDRTDIECNNQCVTAIDCGFEE